MEMEKEDFVWFILQNAVQLVSRLSKPKTQIGRLKDHKIAVIATLNGTPKWTFEVGLFLSFAAPIIIIITLQCM